MNTFRRIVCTIAVVWTLSPSLHAQAPPFNVAPFDLAHGTLGVSRTAQGAPGSSRGAAALSLEGDLAARIAAAIAPLDEVQLTVAEEGSAPVAPIAPTERDLGAALRERGLRLVAQAGDRTAVVRVTCSDSLTQRVCAAGVAKGDTRSVVIASRPRGSSTAAEPAGTVAALSLRPIFAQRDRILDLVELNDRQFLVLDVAALTLYERSGGAWSPSRSASIAAAVPWPRDVRGRLAINGQAIDVFLPGFRCRGVVEGLQLQCEASRAEAWPVGIPGATLAATRNYFTAPGSVPFFSAAAVGTGDRAAWLLAAVDGGWLIVSDGAVARPVSGLGDDVAGVTTTCGSGRQMIAALPNPGGADVDALRVFEVSDRAVTALTPSAEVAGRVTALWPVPGGDRVLVIVENRDAQRHEALYASVSCAR